jgi:hypothetical protein
MFSRARDGRSKLVVFVIVVEIVFVPIYNLKRQNAATKLWRPIQMSSADVSHISASPQCDHDGSNWITNRINGADHLGIAQK